MATLSEQFRSEELRRAHEGTAKKNDKASKREPDSENAHAAKKATYALEEDVEGRPSRKSSRKSANHAKPDANLNAREQLQKGSPTARYRRSRARQVRARASSA